MLITAEYIQAMNNRYHSGVVSLSVLEETKTTVFQNINFKLFSPLFETFNDKLHFMISNGFTQKVFENHVNPNGRKIIEDQIDPQILTMDQLAVGFQICFVPLAFSTIAFLVEVLIPLIKLKFRKPQKIMKKSKILV